MSLTDKMPATKFSVASPNRAVKSIRDRMATGSVEWSLDLARVAGLARRPKPDLGPIIDEMTLRLRKPEGTQVLRPIQAWALYEMSQLGSILGNISVGEGKELLGMLAAMVVPGCRRAVLLIPPDLRPQFFNRDWPEYGEHWVLPNLAGGTNFVDDGRPVLHVIAYSQLSATKSTALLESINPDVILANEVQLLKSFGVARVTRFLNYFAKHPNARFSGWSGTLTTSGLEDYAHLSALALGAGSPLPTESSVVKQWSAALAPNYKTGYFSPGALGEALCLPGEDIRSGFQRRFADTPGVIVTGDHDIGASITFHKRDLLVVPDEVQKHLRTLRADWVRPDGEVFREAMEVFACARQLAVGLYLRWRFPHDEPREMKDAWFLRRQEWNRELRGKLQMARPYMESPKLCENAAVRYYAGGCAQCGRPSREDHAPGCGLAESEPLWAADCWLPWAAVKDSVFHVTDHVWVDEFLVRDAAEWALAKPGIVWVEHVEVGHKLAQLTGLRYYGGGEEASKDIIKEDGSKSIIASCFAHSKGKNLQGAFHRNLITSFSTDAALVEQYLGRTHRSGQTKDVEVFMYLHTPEGRDALTKARARARYVQDTMKSKQKLIYGDWAFTS